MSILSRDDILGVQDLKTEEIKVPEWGGTVLVRSLTGAERDAYEQAVLDSRDEEGDKVRNIRARLVAASIVNEDGEQEFSLDDVDALGAKNARALERVFNVAMKLSGISEDDVEDLEGNSGGGPSESSTSA